MYVSVRGLGDVMNIVAGDEPADLSSNPRPGYFFLALH